MESASTITKKLILQANNFEGTTKTYPQNCMKESTWSLLQLSRRNLETVFGGLIFSSWSLQKGVNESLALVCGHNIQTPAFGHCQHSWKNLRSSLRTIIPALSIHFNAFQMEILSLRCKSINFSSWSLSFSSSSLPKSF